MASAGPLDEIRTNSASAYRKGQDDVAQQRSRKLTQSRLLTENDIDALAVLEYAAQDILQKYHAAMRQMEVRLETLDQDLKLRQRRLTENDIDALAVLEYAAQDILQKYHAAMRQMEVRLETLDQDLKLRQRRNPIHHIESRMKSIPSIFEKLERYGKSVTLESMEANIMDIAGLRVIVSYVQDSYDILDYLEHQDDLTVVTVKDYIANPKPNGYRSLHLIVKIPVYFLDSKEEIPVEIQIRTIAMDFWASLEHDLKYKAVRCIVGVDSDAELKECSRIIEDVENRMQVLAAALDSGTKEKPLKYKAVRCIVGVDSDAELKECSRIIEDVENRMQVLAAALDSGTKEKPRAGAVSRAKMLDLKEELEWPEGQTPDGPSIAPLMGQPGYFS